MIKISAKTRNVRETTSLFEYNDDSGKLVKKEDFRVQYYSWTSKDVKEIRAKERADIARKLASAAKPKKDVKKEVDESAQLSEQLAKADEFMWFSDELMKLLHALPDLADENGKPFKITLANLDMLDVKNLERIYKAIGDDIAGKAQPSK